MPKKPEHLPVHCRFFRWRLFLRDGIFWADGRSGNKINAGRHSLEERERASALVKLERLDRLRAVELGLAQAEVLREGETDVLALEVGSTKYLEYVGRPTIMGGAGKTTIKRYRAVFNKFNEFAGSRGTDNWHSVTKSLLQSYAAWLDDEGYAYATEYLELTTIKQAMKWMIEEAKLLPLSCSFILDLKKPQGTTTYCYTPAEVDAMVQFCRSTKELNWLADVIVALAHTGMRIGELANLRWADLDADLSRIELVDERRRAGKTHRAVARCTKTHRDRVIPVHPVLQEVLRATSHDADGRVFHGPKGGLLKPDTLRIILEREVLKPLSRKFPAATGKLGLIDGRLHSFRHYFCSAAASSRQVDQETLKSWLGHQDSRMVRHYFHTFEDRATEQMKNVNFVGTADATLASATST